jgi:hypothetical protein
LAAQAGEAASEIRSFRGRWLFAIRLAARAGLGFDRERALGKVRSGFPPATRSNSLGIDHVYDFGLIQSKIIVI